MARRRIDVHQHVVPPQYASWLRALGISDAGGRELPPWSVEEALELMDDHEIDTAILSVSTPGVHLDPSRTRCTQARAKKLMNPSFTPWRFSKASLCRARTSITRDMSISLNVVRIASCP